MRVPGQQPALGQPQQLRFRILAQRAVRGVRDLLIANAAVKRGAAVAEDFVVYLRAKLLGTKEHHVEVPTPRGDIDEGIAKRVLRAGGRVLVELIDKDNDLVHAERV